MKICDLTQSYSDHGGGIQTYIQAKRNYIEKHTDWEHVLIVPGGKDDIIRDGRLTTCLVAAAPVPNCEPYRFIFRLREVLKILRREKPDVIELGSAYNLPWVAWWYSLFHPCALVGFYHTDFPTAYVNVEVEKAVGPKVAKIAEWVAWRYARLVYRRCQATISAAQMFYQKLVDHKIRNVKYYPFGVDTDIFSPARRSDELRQKLTADDDTVVLLYVGRLNYEKRINILLDAFAALAKTANIRLAFVGDGNLAAEIAERQKKEPRIHLLPYETDREKLGEIYASADIYCTAGPHETFGLCVLEAQAAGLPVVGVNAGALVERVPDGMGLLAEADSVDSFAEQLTLMLNSDYQAIGRRTREYVVEHYSWDYFFKRLLRRYEITYAEKGRLRKRRLKAKPATELG